jgi:hypothetical protein
MYVSYRCEIRVFFAFACDPKKPILREVQERFKLIASLTRHLHGARVLVSFADSPRGERCEWQGEKQPSKRAGP